jgi:hypothetical protein
MSWSPPIYCQIPLVHSILRDCNCGHESGPVTIYRAKRPEKRSEFPPCESGQFAVVVARSVAGAVSRYCIRQDQRAKLRRVPMVLLTAPRTAKLLGGSALAWSHARAAIDAFMGGHACCSLVVFAYSMQSTTDGQGQSPS